MEVEEDGRRLYYILDGRAGYVHYPEGVACVLDHDIQDGLLELPEGYGDDYENKEIRRGRTYEYIILVRHSSLYPRERLP